MADNERDSYAVLMSRATFLRTAVPHLVADVRMYAADANGRKSPAVLGWGVPCMISLAEPLKGWDAWPIFDETRPLEPGESRQVGFYFLSGDEATRIMREAGHFYLWEGRPIGEAVVVS